MCGPAGLVDKARLYITSFLTELKKETILNSTLFYFIFLYVFLRNCTVNYELILMIVFFNT